MCPEAMIKNVWNQHQLYKSRAISHTQIGSIFSIREREIGSKSRMKPTPPRLSPHPPTGCLRTFNSVIFPQFPIFIPSCLFLLKSLFSQFLLLIIENSFGSDPHPSFHTNVFQIDFRPIIYTPTSFQFQTIVVTW